MNSEDISKIENHGFFVPNYMAKDEYVFVEESTMKKTLSTIIKLALEGKRPVVMIIDKPVHKKSEMVECYNYYKMMKYITKPAKLTIFETMNRFETPMPLCNCGRPILIVPGNTDLYLCECGDRWTRSNYGLSYHGNDNEIDVCKGDE